MKSFTTAAESGLYKHIHKSIYEYYISQSWNHIS